MKKQILTVFTRQDLEKFAAVIALSVLLFVPLPAQAQERVENSTNSQHPRGLLENVTFLLHPSQSESSCGPAVECSASIFEPEDQVVCPGPSGKTCLFHITVSATLYVDAYNIGYLSFYIDGHYSSFPAEQNQVVWTDTSAATIPIFSDVRAITYSVIGSVTNQTDNQPHTVEINAACAPGALDYCDIIIRPGAMAQIEVYRSSAVTVIAD